MTTPLFWKSWQLSNAVYSTILRYPFVLSINLEVQQFVVEYRHKKLVPFYMAATNLTIFLVVYAALVLRALISDTTEIQIHLLIVNIFTTCMIGLCLSLVAIILPFKNEIINQYFNTIFKLEKRLKGIIVRNNSKLFSWKDTIAAGTQIVTTLYQIF